MLGKTMRHGCTRATAALGILAVLGGCNQSTLNETRPVSAVPMEVRHDRPDGLVRLIAQKCPVTGVLHAESEEPAQQDVGGPNFAPAAGVALATLVPLAVDVGVSAVRDYLARQQSERTGKWQGTGVAALKKGEWCLVVLRGWIGGTEAGNPNLPPQGSLRANFGRNDDEGNIPLTATPDFYLEAQLSARPERDRLNLTLRPRFLHFARTAALSGRDESKALAMVLVLQRTPLPANANQDTAQQNAEAAFALDLGAVRPGTEIQRAANGDPFENLRQVSTINATGAATPMNIGAFVVEAGQPDEVLRLMNATMARQGDALTKALSEAIQAAIKEAAKSN